jgi:hypothetical protein
MGGNPAFRGTRVPVHMLAKLVPSRAHARTRYRRGSVGTWAEILIEKCRVPSPPGITGLVFNQLCEAV